MRICVISSTVFACPPPGYSGLEQLAWQQAEGLAKKGHLVALIAPDGSKCDHASVIPTGPPGGWGEQQAYGGFKYKTGRKGKDAQGREVEEEITVPPYWPELHKFDAIIDHSWNKWSYMLKAEGKLKAPVLGVCHAPVNTMYSSLPPVEKPCFVCISKDQAAHFEALFSPATAKVAYNGIDLDFYKPIEGVKRGGRFLFLARFSTIKGPDLAIQACRQAGVGLDLVGDTSITNEPEFLAECKRMCDGLSTSDNKTQILLRGPANRGECVWWFSQAHCLLHPNQRFREPFGLAPIEAMACGTPVICWDYGAMRETIKQYETGWLVKTTDELMFHIREVAQHGTKLRDRCREWAGQFSVQNMIDRYESLCQEAIEGGGW